LRVDELLKVCFSLILIPRSEDEVKIKVKVHHRIGHENPEKE